MNRRGVIWVGSTVAAASVAVAMAASSQAAPQPSDPVVIAVISDTAPDPRTPSGPLPGVNDELGKLMKANPAVVASGELDGPQVTQSPVPLP